MSYLNPLRLVFHGRFQADPSTVNNDAKHYLVDGFEPSWQEYTNADGSNGWWNPDGTGAFRLLDCKVSGVNYANGSAATDPRAEPLLNALVLNAADRSAGKIVDLDPLQQMVSQIWGMQVRLALPGEKAATNLVSGNFTENPFRDIWFTRMKGKSGSEAASAIFQSVLTNLEWADGFQQSPFLSALRESCQCGSLSIRLVTYGYTASHLEDNFTYGSVIGAIGPYLAGEPRCFVAGRRLAPQYGSSSGLNISFTSGEIVRYPDHSDRLLLDLANSLPLDANGQPLDLGELSVALLQNTSAPEGSPALGDAVLPFGTIPYRSLDWMNLSGGIVELPLTVLQALLCQQQPLALLAQPGPDTYPIIALREDQSGLFACADPFVLRIDSSNTEPGTASVTLYARQFGAPLGQAKISLTPSTAWLDGSDFPVGTPSDAVTYPTTVTTGLDGTVPLTISASPPGNPRQRRENEPYHYYLDGQVYCIAYSLPGQTPVNAPRPSDFINIHVRDAYDLPETPTWEAHVRPLLQLYANLYPVMSRGLFQLSNPHSVVQFRKALLMAFSAELNDPNSMPVTRDLSANKRKTIVTWLQRLDTWVANPQEPSFDPGFTALLKTSAPPEAGRRAAQPPHEHLDAPDSKAAAFQAFQHKRTP